MPRAPGRSPKRCTSASRLEQAGRGERAGVSRGDLSARGSRVASAAEGGRLLAATDPVRADRGLYWRLFETEYRATLSRIEAMLDAEALQRSWSEGQAMPLELAIEYAQSVSGVSG